jgi:hypothetical protein
MRYRVFLLSLITLGCCSPKSKQDRNPKHGESQTEGRGTSISSESFNEFYKRFSSDSAYQVSRIIFPLRMQGYDLDSDVPTTSTMDAKEWRYMNFDLKKPYILKIKAENDTVEVNIRKEETGILVDYLFTPINSKWMLVKVVDQST